MDNLRIAEYYNIPFEWPVPDPVKFTNGIPDDDQSLVYNFSRLGVLADLSGFGFDFVEQLARLIWDGKTKEWNRVQNIKKITNSLGLDYENMQEKINNNTEYYDEILINNGKELEDAGHWGVPTLVIENEPFFGQDRLELFEWRLNRILSS